MMDLSVVLYDGTHYYLYFVSRSGTKAMYHLEYLVSKVFNSLN